MSTRYLVIFGIATLALLIGGIVLLSKVNQPKSGVYDTFAKCIAEKKLTMYGAYWCSHCKAEKARFGDSFQYVPYVECTVEIKKCESAGVNSYPTWIDAAGNKYEGEQGLEKLAQISGCALPSK